MYFSLLIKKYGCYNNVIQKQDVYEIHEEMKTDYAGWKCSGKLLKQGRIKTASVCPSLEMN